MRLRFRGGDGGFDAFFGWGNRFDFLHRIDGICTEINWEKREIFVQYSVATEEKSFRGESRIEAG